VAALVRRQAREVVLKTLFAVELGRIDPAQTFGDVVAEGALPVSGVEFAARLLDGVLARRPAIDELIAQHATEWRLDRLANIDRNILRLALYEMVYCPDIPTSVSINEAVELAKAYGEADSPKFINGVLGQVARNLKEE
jgi:N utilization substance protein B